MSHGICSLKTKSNEYILISWNTTRSSINYSLFKWRFNLPSLPRLQELQPLLREKRKVNWESSGTSCCLSWIFPPATNHPDSSATSPSTVRTATENNVLSFYTQRVEGHALFSMQKSVKFIYPVSFIDTTQYHKCAPRGLNVMLCKYVMDFPLPHAHVSSVTEEGFSFYRVYADGWLLFSIPKACWRNGLCSWVGWANTSRRSSSTCTYWTTPAWPKRES